MIEVKKKTYKKAYTELNEIFKIMSANELNKIPNNFIANIQKEMDKNYEFVLDKNKQLIEQELMTETKALIVKIYERFLAPESEKEMWQNYDRYCLQEIEKQKKERYNPDDVFKNRNKVSSSEAVTQSEIVTMIKYKKDNLFTKIINKIKSFFNI